MATPRRAERPTGVLVPSLAMSFVGIVFLVPFVWLVVTAFKTHGNLTLGGGGPGNASNVLSVFMYRQAFSNYELAYGTAIAVVLLLIGAVLAAVYIRLLRRQGSLAEMR